MMHRLRAWFITPALNNTRSELEKSKIVLTFNFFAAYFVFTLFFTAYLLYFHAYHSFLDSLFSAVSLILVLFLIRWERSLNAASKLFFATNYVSTIFFVLIGKGEISILNGMWFILLNIFMYLNLSRRLSLVCFILVIFAFNPLALLKFNGYEALNDPGYNDGPYHAGILIQILAAFAFMFYIIKEFIDKRGEAFDRLVYNEIQKRALLDAIPDRMFRVTGKGVFLDYNIEPTAVNGRPVSSIKELGLSDELKEIVISSIQEAIRTGNLQTQEIMQPMQDGSFKFFEARTKKIGDDEVVSIVRDITEKKQAEQELEISKNFTEKILNSSPNLIWIYDYEKEKNIFINKEFVSMLGYTPDQIAEMGKTTILSLCHPDDLPKLLQHTREDTMKLRDGEITEVEYRLRDVKGEWHWLLARRMVFLRSADGKVKQTLTTAQEITLRKQAEEEIILEKERAEEASQAKAQFLSVMSHEIRTPINAVIGLTSILLLENPRKDQLENLQVLKSSADHLLSLVSDILDFSKIESGKIEFEETQFVLSDVLENIQKIFSQKALEKNIELRVQKTPRLPYKITGDLVRLNQILANLVDNAIKFTDEGSVKVQYRISEEEVDAVSITFEVADTGIGIPEDKKAHIFESFTQASSDTTRRFGGTGLGLAICMKLVELQGGNIAVDSVPGSGSVFSFSLTFKKGQPVQNEEISIGGKSEDVSLKGLRILVVEDNDINVFVLNKFLSRWQAETETAVNGIEAVEKVKQGNFDAVLMDLQMPGLDGYGATGQIRKIKDPKINSIPIIALTAAASMDTRTEVLKKGMNDYVTKPFNPQELYSILSKYLKANQ